MDSIIVIVPIYKSTLDTSEIISFNQCIKVLCNYTISIVTFKELDIKYYKYELEKAKITYIVSFFASEYFFGTEGYNRLMLSLDFYKKFEKYKYMLIYQLDAYIFIDELKEWCAKGYDIIGAPLIEDKYAEEKKYFLNHYNGGFSLRNITYCMQLLSYKGPLLKPNIIYRIVKKEFKGKPLMGFIYFVLRSLGRQNNVAFLKRKTPINEDLLLTLGLFVSWIDSDVTRKEAWIYPKLPSNEEAIKFAFERYPSYLFELNSNKLPMGCHAWEKFEYDTFWGKYINVKGIL